MLDNIGMFVKKFVKPMYELMRGQALLQQQQLAATNKLLERLDYVEKPSDVVQSTERLQVVFG